MDSVRIPGIFAERIEAQGLSAVSVLRRAGISTSILSQERITISTAQLFSLWSAIEDLSGDPAIGLKIGSDTNFERYHPVSIAAIAARTFRDALASLARYKLLMCSEEMRVQEADGVCTIELVWQYGGEIQPDLLIDAAFASFVLLGRHGTGMNVRPERLDLKREARNREMYEAHFGCPVEFGADRNRLTFSIAAVEQAFVTHNPGLLSVLAPQLESLLIDYKSQQRLPDKVKAIQTRLLAGQKYGINEVASELNMSARTLQRRLAAEGHTFQSLLDTARREMAQKYLTKSSLDLAEISFLLGYEEANSFNRAFRGWVGVSPTQWRSQRT
jgi:AraC-like DNA-binding protein